MSKISGFKLFAGDCRFVIGAPSLDVIPDATQPEIAFIGLSNVGKSSLINALTNRNELARTSVTPGRTQQLNFFLLGERMLLVDLPGYGYAKVSKKQLAEWEVLIRGYLRGRPNLARVLVLVDARRGLKASDHEMMDMLDDAAVSYQVVLTKADKIANDALEQLKAETKAALAKHAACHPDIFSTSAHKKAGLEELKDALAALL